MQSLTNEKNELTSIFLLVHHDSPSAFSYLSIHSFMHPSTIFLHSSPNLHTLWFHRSMLSYVHTSSTGSLRQEVLQLQLSAKVSLKGNSSDPWPQLHVLLKAYPKAPESYYSACSKPSSHSCYMFFFFHLHWKVLTLLSLIHDLLRLCIILTGWLTLQHHDLTHHHA